MIDWTGVGAAALWIAGLALIFAALSRARCLAGRAGARFQAVLQAPSTQTACSSGLALFSAGLFFGVRATWERIAWAVSALLCAIVALLEWRRGLSRVRHPEPGTEGILRHAQNDMAGRQNHRVAQQGGTIRWLASAVQRAELWWVLVALPFLLLPNRYSVWALAAIAVLWVLRFAATGHLTLRTPVDWPVLGMLLLLPVTLWATVDTGLTHAALYGLLAGIALLYAVVNWTSSPQRLAIVTSVFILAGFAMAAIAPFAATTWSGPKLFNALAILSRLPMASRPLIPEDINGNVLAGGLIVVWPVVATLTLARLDSAGFRAGLLRVLLAGCLATMTAVLILTQSRGAFLALGVGLAVMGALRWPAVRYVLLLALMALPILLWRAGAQQLQQVADALSSTGTVTSLAGREEVWSRAIYMLEDMPLTGIGMGAFDRVQPLLYPFFLSSGVVHHAHNLFLQVGVDLGLPGLIAYLALWIGSVYSTWRAWRKSLETRFLPETRFLSSLLLGLLGSQTALLVHGLTDAVVWGTKLAFLPWLAIGLAVAAEGALS